MVSLDYSIIPAIIIFLTVVFALNYLLIRPLLRVQAERESKTTGLTAEIRKKLDHHLELFGKYEATLKNGRMDGYRMQEQHRSKAMTRRAESLEQARSRAEQMVEESRASIRAQLQAAKSQLGEESHEIARDITAAILQRSA